MWRGVGRVAVVRRDRRGVGESRSRRDRLVQIGRLRQCGVLRGWCRVRARTGRRRRREGVSRSWPRRSRLWRCTLGALQLRQRAFLLVSRNFLLTVMPRQERLEVGDPLLRRVEVLAGQRRANDLAIDTVVMVFCAERARRNGPRALCETGGDQPVRGGATAETTHLELAPLALCTLLPVPPRRQRAYTALDAWEDALRTSPGRTCRRPTPRRCRTSGGAWR